MRFMMLMIPKGYESASPGTTPPADGVAAMMKYNRELQEAGVLLGLDGLHPPSMGARVSFPGGKPKVQDGPQGWPFTQLQIKRGTLAGTISAFGNIANGATMTGTFGFASTPPDIQAVAIDTVVAAFQARKDVTSGVIVADEGALVPWSGFFGMGSPQRVTLERYRYIGFASIT